MQETPPRDATRPAMRVRIRRCRMRDLERVRALARRTYDETFRHLNDPAVMDQYLADAFSRPRMERELRSPLCSFFFLFVGGALGGFLKLNVGQAQTDLKGEDTLEIERIYVVRELQGRGLGRILLEKAESIARRRKKGFVWLGVWERNTNAIGFYRRMGFVPAGTHDFQMGSELQTDFIMKKNLV
jgi:diamine N-acetyltransferase